MNDNYNSREFIKPDGEIITVKNFYFDTYPLPMKFESNLTGEKITYYNGYDEEMVGKTNMDDLVVEVINQFDEETRRMVDSYIYRVKCKAVKPMFEIKEIDYCTPASNTNSNYKVLITLSSENGYTRKFMVELNTINYTAYEAMELAVSTLDEQLRQGMHGAEAPQEDDCIYGFAMYNKDGLSYTHEFESNNFEEPFRDSITGIQIADFELVIKN